MGSLDVDGIFQSYTLEPVTRQDDLKPRAIPEGSYPLKMLHSDRFGKDMPHVLGVTGFTEVEIHPGNYPADTKACLLVGKSKGVDAIFESDQAFSELMAKLDGQDDMIIEYVEERAISA